MCTDLGSIFLMCYSFKINYSIIKYQYVEYIRVKEAYRNEYVKNLSVHC